MTAASVDPGGPQSTTRATRTKALLLINRNARHGQSDARAALEVLARRGFDVLEEHVDQPRQMSRTIRRARGRVDAVIIGGGDGTLNMAADGLVDVQLPLGILPMGTANDLARTLGIPTHLAAAADVIARGHQKRIDLGWVNGRHFFNVATVGLGAAVTRRLSRERKSRWGSLAYLFAAAQVVVHARPFAAHIRAGGETLRVRTVQITIGNGRHYGGGMTVDATARIDDGMLDLISLEVEHWWQIVRLLPSLRRGTLSGAPHVRTLCGREFEVRTVKKRRRIRVTADGEISGRTPAHFRIVPQALAVFVPVEPATEG